MPRSGTSLVEQILASHPHVYGAGELTTIGDLAATLGRSTGSQHGYPRNVLNAGTEAIESCAAEYLRQIAALSGEAPRVSDKMPHNFLYLGLIDLMFPGARVIHVARDPMDTCLSLFFQTFNSMHSYSTDLTYLGAYYRQYERLMNHWERVLRIPMLTVRYETLVEDVEKATRDMLEFCELPWDPVCLQFHASGRIVKTPSYDQVRQPIYRSSVARWRRYEKHLGALMAALGAPGGQRRE
jgi:hypothetical protein